MPGFSFYNKMNPNIYSTLHNDEQVDIEFRTDTTTVYNYSVTRKEDEEYIFYGFVPKDHLQLSMINKNNFLWLHTKEGSKPDEDG